MKRWSITMITYEQARANLTAELDAWDKFDAEREPLPEEVEELRASADFGPGSSIIRSRQLIPLILERLENDTKGKPYPVDLVAQMLSATTAILATKRRWFSERNNLDPDIYPSAQEKAVMDASKSFQSALKKWSAPGIRFKDDMNRLFLDLWIIGSWLLDFADNARRHGEWPPDEPGEWSAKEWCAYFWRNLARRSPFISYVERHGLSIESLDKGFAAEEIFSRRSNQRTGDFVKRYEMERQLAAVWDKKHPLKYLDLKKLPPPPPEDNSDLVVESIDVAEEAQKQGGDWSRSIPEIRKWDDESDERPERQYQKDPAFRELDKFTSKIIKASKENWHHQQLESDHPADYRPPLDQYLVLLVLSAQGVMIHGLIDEYDDAGISDANRTKGCHLFCAEVFTKFAQTINLYKDSAYRNLGAEALKLAGKISKI
ncbi:MAG: hypothetical protein AB1599_01380 [Planctomycetota bacterium]